MCSTSLFRFLLRPTTDLLRYRIGVEDFFAESENMDPFSLGFQGHGWIILRSMMILPQPKRIARTGEASHALIFKGRQISV